MKLIEHALCVSARLFVSVPDRCMVPIPLRAALELNVLGAPGATLVTCARILGTSRQDATNPRPFACRRGVTPQSYLAGSWVHGRLSHLDTFCRITRQFCLKFMGFHVFSMPLECWMILDLH